MSALQQLVRPAARSAAVRPHSASLPSPGPASAASRWRASLFFAPFTPALWEQLGLWPSACRVSGRRGVVTGTPLGTPLGTPKPLQSLDIPEPLPRYHSPPAHVIRSRARACAILSLSLVTWEQRRISYVGQWVRALPSPFPAPRPVGTWEQAQGAATAPDRLCGRSNKLEPGYGDLQRPGARAPEKFRAAIAAGGDLVELELGRIQLQLTRRNANGRFPPFPSARAGQVGRAMLEGSRQAAEKAGDLGPRLKLGRLHGRALGELGGQLLEVHQAAGAAADRREGTPRAPNRARAAWSMLALHARRIWIEDRFQWPASRGDYSDWSLDCRKNAQTVDQRPGPGGAALWQAARGRCEAANAMGGERAGVPCLPTIARLHDAGGNRTLSRVLAAVKCPANLAGKFPSSAPFGCVLLIWRLAK